MTDLLRRFRGLGIALAVLAISAGAVFAGAPHLAPTAAHPAQAQQEDRTSEPSESPDQDQDGDHAKGAAATPETPEAPDADEDAAETGAPADTHGAIVSAAAKAETPAGFKNHGQFVSCVARMDGLDPATFDPAKVTPAACGITPVADKVTGKDKAAQQKAKGAEKSAAAKARAAQKAAAGKAKAAANQAAHGRP
jgi:hypothetical protein